MKLEYINHNLTVTGLKDFNLKHIFDCGQCFRFNEISPDIYLGVAKGKALKISQSGDSITLYDTSKEDWDNIWFDFFDLSRDYGKIKQVLSRDNVMKKAVTYGDGIRILNQDLWEAVISFIISASNNIPRIKGIIERLCTAYGDKIEYMGSTYYSFPDANTVSNLNREDLAVIRAGYRDKYIIDAAKKFNSGEISEKLLSPLSTPQVKEALMTINGIGNKVSDCILLFGMQRTDSFPVDVWIKRIMEYCYFDSEQSIAAISQLARERFGDLGGFAQQYLFFYARENKIGTK